MKSARRLITWGLTMAVAVAFGVSPSLAGVGISIAPTYPGFVNVGDTGIPVTLMINNGADGPEASEQLLISNILHTPACGSSDFPCPVGSKDPGVFKVNGPGVGSAACAGMMFNVAITDASTGTVTFTPQSGSVTLQPKNMPNDKCGISFTVDALKVPTHDASGSPGLMTNQLAKASAQAVNSGTTGSGTGSNQVTVRAPGEVCLDCLRRAPAVGLTGSAALAMLLLGGGLGAMRRRRSARG